jgi:hypothetical protein
MTEMLHLYLDDSGSRYPDHRPKQPRADGMDHFAFGGIIVRAADVDTIFPEHRAFCHGWDISYSLHSAEIRGGRSNFAWLATDDARRASFLGDLQAFLLQLPVTAIAAVVHRPGYVARYKERYGSQTWLMCKTAFSILVERAAKYARSQNAKLEIYFEQAGKREDRAIKEYGRCLKTQGMPFDTGASAAYGLSPEDFTALLVGEPRERTKKTPMMQIADLMLYPVAKAGYEPAYPPYRALWDHKRVINALLPAHSRASLGCKYSCFEVHKQQDPAFAGS